MNTNKGFTLIELMIVMAIIGVLFAIAVPHIVRLKEKRQGIQRPEPIATQDTLRYDTRDTIVYEVKEPKDTTIVYYKEPKVVTTKKTKVSPSKENWRSRR